MRGSSFRPGPCATRRSLCSARLRWGLATTALTVLEEVTRRCAPSRALSLPFPLGYPLGKPFERKLHRRIVQTALDLLYRSDVPVLEVADPLRLASQ